MPALLLPRQRTKRFFLQSIGTPTLTPEIDVMKPSCRAVLAVALVLSFAPLPDAWATVYNLGADWSSVANPNGVWSYNQGAAPLPFYQTNWAGVGGDGWTTTSTGIVPPAWILAVSAFGNAAVGDVVVHSTNFGGPLARVTWTSPGPGVLEISGQAWDVAHIAGRDDEWTLYLNATPLATRASILGVVKDSANAAFANNLLIGQSLTSLAVNAGDVVSFEVRQTQNNNGHFTGVDLSIELVPEPSAVALAGVGLLIVGAGRTVRRRRARSGRVA
jgi:hypothetical protein